jgi:hypothetical protein
MPAGSSPISGDPTPQPGPTPDQQAAAMNQLGTVIGNMVARAVAPLGDKINALETKLNTPPPPPKPPEIKTPAELDRLVTDPDGWFNEKLGPKFDELAKAKLGPYFAIQMQEAREGAERGQRERIDSRYGKGTWDEHFSADFTKAMSSLPEIAQHNPKTIEKMVDGMIGSDQLMPVLEERKQKVAAQREQEERTRPPSFLGRPGTSPMRDETEITHEDRQVQQALKSAGFEFGDENIKVMRAIPKGVDLDTQLEAYEKATKKAS